MFARKKDIMENRFEKFTTSILKISRGILKIKSFEMEKYGLKPVHAICIYYLNVNLYKNVYAIQDGEVVKIKEEKEGYYDLLKALDNVLEPFTLQGPDGKIYEIGEKRIYVPMMVFVKNGKIIGTHVGTVTLEGSQTKYDALKENQYKELFKIYEDYIAEISENDYCDEGRICC